ncbi:MAG TPA: MmgE/PrpD family protein [Candidatus Methylomirabilis sp.]|nr:MmgE/PrpD family protein [Candidatus Methylomirabilis sp.]
MLESAAPEEKRFACFAVFVVHIAMNETRALVEHCHAIGQEPLSPDMAAYARLLLMDYLGVAAASAMLEEPSRIARDVAAQLGGEPEASAFGLDRKLPAPLAAFVNGVTEHGIEMDDTHAGGSSHPGVVVWSVGLAVGERQNSTGARLLSAAAAGYEMACRVALAASPAGVYARGFHPTSVAGVFGAAMTAGCLLDLSPEHALNAVGIAGSFASGNMEYLAQGTFTKRIQPGQAAHAGILSALLAQRGYTGPSTILEGEAGILRAYSGSSSAEHLVAHLGETREMMQTGMKFFGCCRYMQSPMEAALLAVRGQTWDIQDIVAIRAGLVSAGWSLVADPIEQKYVPKTRVDAQFSLPFGIATALVNGRGTVNEFRETQILSPTILDLARRVTIHHDDELDRAYPARWPAWCEIELRDGRRLRADVSTSKGDPENPVTPAEAREKFDALAMMYWTKDQARRVADAVKQVDRFQVRRLMSLVNGGRRTR